MKWIGKFKQKIDEKESDLSGKSFVNLMAIIEENDDVFNIKLYEIMPDGSQIADRSTRGSWCRSLSTAKRIINKDTGFKASDWEWSIGD